MEEAAGSAESPGEAGSRPGAAESWYQLLPEADASVVPALSETHMEHTEFASIEEGTLQSLTGLGRMHSLRLDMQDSSLSPCLPLLTSASTPGHKFFGDTLFQQTETDFAPLRASLDTSDFPGPPSLQMRDAVVLASKEVLLEQADRDFSLSQHVSGMSPAGGGDVSSSTQYLSQHPLSVSHGDRGDHVIPMDADPESGEMKRAAGKETTQLSVEELSREDGAFLCSSVPAPVLLELLEKEVGLSGSSSTSSRRSSQSVPEPEKVDVLQQEPAPGRHRLNMSAPGVEAERGTVPEPLRQGEAFPGHHDTDVLRNVMRESAALGGVSELHPPGTVIHQTGQPPPEPPTGDLHKQLCSEIQQRYQEKELSEENSAAVPSDRSAEVAYHTDDTAEAHSPDEMTISRCSIERGHKDTETLHAGNTPLDETAFIDRLAHPISQSTPGTFPVSRKPLSGRIQQIKAKLTGSEMSLDEEPSGASPNTEVAPKGVPQSVQSSQGYPESSDSQRSLSPQRRRIQSLPSLNYIEKVGTWNTNQSFDALVLRGLTGVSPKKLAYDAVANSLNRLLSRQTSGTVPRKGPAASFKGASSMSNLDVGASESSAVSQLARSQSYNSVVPAGGGNASEKWTEAAVEGRHDMATSSSVRSSGATGSASTLLSNNADDEVKCNDGASGVGKTEDTQHQEREKEPGDVVTMGLFSDVSLDHEFSSSSHSGGPIGEMLLGSTASSKHELTSSDADHFVPFWTPAEKTPEKDELNIEERIPTYLRNLGIDQSPTTILTPFALKGPIREPEFSPTELRTIKGSTATPSRSTKLSEGGSQSGPNISQSSLYSSASTTSVSIPMGSMAGPESPSSTEMSPVRPVSQDDTMAQAIESPLEECSFQTSDREKMILAPAAPPATDVRLPQTVSHALQQSDHTATESSYVKQLVDQFDSGGYDLQSAAKQPLNADSINDSFVGSKTLKEIRKLLEEADDVGLDGTGSGVHLASPLRDPYGMTPPVGLNLEDSLKSLDSLKSGTLTSRSESPLDLLVKDMSWDTSFNSSVMSDNLGNKDSWVKADPQFGDYSGHSSPVKDNSYIGELVKPRRHPAANITIRDHWGRSEPEGSSEATGNKVKPSGVQDNRDGGRCGAGDISGKVQRSEELLSSVTSSVGNLKQTLALTGAGYIRSREVESDESSGDSLAARVTSLLKSATPFPSASRVLQTAEEDGGRVQRSVKLKLASPPMMMKDTDLSEEDRRRIEEIKKELLDGARKAERLKDGDHSRVGASDLAPMRDTPSFRLQLTPSPAHGHLHVTSSQDSLENRSVQLFPPSSGDNVRGDATALEIGKDLMIPASYHEGLMTELHTPGQTGGASRGVDTQSVLPVILGDDAKKPIASITFSSRKRSSSRSISPSRSSPRSISPSPKAADSEWSQIVVFDKSTIDLDFQRTQPHVALRSTDDHRSILAQDVSISHLPGIDEVPYQLPAAVPTEDRHSEKGDQVSVPAWAEDREFSSDILPPQYNSLPTSERSNSLLPHGTENANLSHDTLLPGGPVASSRHHQIQGPDADQSMSYSEQFSAEKTQTSGIYLSSSHKLLTGPALVSPPTMKALSCIHVTISPKEDLGVPDALVGSDVANDAPDSRLRANPKTSTLPPSNLSRNESVPASSPYFLHSPAATMSGGTTAISEDTVQVLGKENIPEMLTQSDRRRWPLSDAATQITTESPERTSFSAEIFIDGTQHEDTTSSLTKDKRTPEIQPPSRPALSGLCRATDQPVLLPYKPPGSPELFYVPCMEMGYRMSPVSTIESSHPGSNDAISPKFPVEVLGSASEKLSDHSLPRHTEGIYSKDPLPKIAWEKIPEQRRSPTGFRDGLGLSNNLSQQKQTPTPDSEPKNELGGYGNASYGTLQLGVSHPESELTQRLDHRRENYHLHSSFGDSEFFPLRPDVDRTEEQPLKYDSLDMPSGLTQTKKTGYTVPSFEVTDVHGRSLKNTDTPGSQSYSPTSSRDSNLSLSGKHAVRGDPRSSSSRDNNVEGRFQKTESIRSQSIVSSQSLDELWARFTQRSKSQLSDSTNKLEISLVERLDRLARLLQNSAPNSLLSPKDVKKSPQILTDNEIEEGSETKRDQRYRKKSALKSQKVGGTPYEMETSDSSGSLCSQNKPYGNVSSSGSLYSDLPSEKRSTVTESASTESEAATQTSSEVTIRTGSSGSMSTIDTVRLINAFGPERVRPSSKLSRLYSTIDLQKKKPSEISKKPSRGSSHRQQSGMGISELQKSPKKDLAFSDISWEPSAALKHKRGSKVHNKGIQAALSWFVPADDVQSDSRKENKMRPQRGPGQVWFEQMTNAKPWREPLREKNLQDLVTRREDHLQTRSQILSDTESKSPRPFVRVTLQESLKTHRPDFIFRSGERVKRLRLLSKERKLQQMFQSEREELFNQPARGRVSRRQNPITDSRRSQRNSAIPRSEMIARSRRIYEQLPEITRRKDEEKRRTEYESYRLKAQLFRKKVTNHILGRKTPWN
ncbi:centrosome-associated protein ALMS1 isoform X2 [Pseudophryne corroboree]|uniref:centrosome-associated protein ALMS1 isoform X2 n=1 Tax=Pseudophryne corroboree TaxID=495146 RepID=UPI0030818FD0